MCSSSEILSILFVNLLSRLLKNIKIIIEKYFSPLYLNASVKKMRANSTGMTYNLTETKAQGQFSHLSYKAVSRKSESENLKLAKAKSQSTDPLRLGAFTITFPESLQLLFFLAPPDL
jgi:hypothetical protein